MKRIVAWSEDIVELHVFDWEALSGKHIKGRQTKLLKKAKDFVSLEENLYYKYMQKKRSKSDGHRYERRERSSFFVYEISYITAFGCV